MQDTLLQTVLGERYEILSLLGTGGLSRVYKARHLEMDSFVAIKILNRSIADDDYAAKRFQQEARLVSSLDHPNLVKVQSVGIGPDCRPYLVLDYFPGKTLSSLLKEQGTLSTTAACPIFVQLARAVEHAHAAGILHRDLKPGNVLVDDTASGVMLKVIDFGIGKFFGDDLSGEQSLTQTNQLLGTPAYMSPEQCKGQQIDARSDIYSLGCLMYEALAGQPPFVADSPVEVMFQQAESMPKKITVIRPQSTIPEALEALVLKCLEKDPKDRFQNMNGLLRALEGVQSDSHTLTRKLIVTARRLVGAGKNRKLFAGGIVALVLIGLLGAAKMTGDLLQRPSVVTAVDPQLAAMLDHPEAVPVEKIPAVRSAIEGLKTTDGKKADLMSRLAAQAKDAQNYDLLESLCRRAEVLSVSQGRHAHAVYEDRLAEALYLNNKFAQSVRTYEKSLAHFNSDNPRIASRIMLALARLNDGQYHVARRELQALCQTLRPDADPGKLDEAYTYLAVACIGSKKYPEARQHLATALKYTGDPHVAEELIATSYLKENNFAEAESRYKKLIAKGRFRASPVYSMLGRLYWLTKRPDLAEEYFRQALKANEPAFLDTAVAPTGSQLSHQLFLLQEIQKFAHENGRKRLEAETTAQLAKFNDPKVFPVRCDISW